MLPMDNGAGWIIVRHMAFDADIVIAGGGLNGTCLALALRQAGLSVVLVEPRPTENLVDPEFDGRGYALSLVSQRLLSALDLWSDLAPHAEAILEIKVSDGRVGDGPSPFVLEFDHAEIEEGPMGYMVQDRYLRQALLAPVAQDEGLVQITDSVQEQQEMPGGISVTLASGKAFSSKVLVGSDGKFSATASRAGIKHMGWDYEQSALVCAIAHDAPHCGTAHQFFMPSGPLAILPLPGNRSSIVWTESRDTAARIQRLDDADYLDVLRPRFGSFLGNISLEGKRWSYPLSMRAATTFVAPRVALIGDAAHSVHPIAGQGLNAGLKDVAALSEVLVKAARRGEDIGQIDVLERYQHWRSFDVASLVAATDAFNRIFSNDNALVRGVRDIGMGAVNAAPKFRRGFMREAAGLNGDLPRLLRGLPI